jgi:hypothetical protein
VSEFPVKIQLIFSGGYTGELSRVLNQRIKANFVEANGLAIVRPLAIDMSIYMEEDHTKAAEQLGEMDKRLVESARGVGISATARYVSNTGT